MSRFLLKAKHWQLFILIGPYLLTYSFYMLLQRGAFPEIAEILVASRPNFNYLIALMLALFAFGLFGWYASIVNGLSNETPADKRVNLLRFNLIIALPVSLMLLFAFRPVPEIDAFINTSSIIFPWVLLSVFAFFYASYWVVKTLKTTETTQVHFAPFYINLLLIWFYPIGIWVLQPKINKLSSC